MTQTARTASKPLKIVLAVVAGLVVLVAVIAFATSKSAESKLVDGLRAVDPAIVANEGQAVDRAHRVCTDGLTVAHIMGAFYVDAGRAAKMTGPIGAFCQG
jgi:hypothetical protein